jgi:hypothetical protein
MRVFMMRYLLLFLSLSLCNIAVASDSDFRMKEDQSIEVSGLHFEDMDAYLSSDYFRIEGKRCATDAIHARLKITESQKAKKSIQDCTANLTNIQNEYDPSIEMTINVWFHVISTTSGTGNISDSTINQQITVLNEDFKALAGSYGAGSVNTKITFVLAGITRTTNDDWFSDSSTDELAYKTALGKDQTKFINVYTNDAQGYLGYAYFPFGSAGTTLDGVVSLSGSVGGRDNGFGSYDQGRTLVHELGHYFGLHHTFQGGTACQNTFTTGDLLTDTNAESEPFYGGASCSATRSTCSTSDPVDNYMDYNKDSCMNKFTTQQVNRMICSIVNYRPELATFSPVTDNNGKIIPIMNLLLE